MFIDAVIQPHTVREIQGAALQAMIAAADLSDGWRIAATEIAEALNPGHREFEPEVIEAAMRSLKAVLPELLLTHGAASDSGLLSEEESR